jgi:hypothetical protein
MRCSRLTAALLLTLSACKMAPRPEDSARVVEDKARGVRYTVPAGWQSHDGEILSASGSLLTLRVYDLVEADKTFVAGLPDTLLPQLEEWAKYYYVVDGPPTREETTVAGLPATEWTYPIRIRPKDPQSKVTYWVVRRATRLFIIRAAFAARALGKDEPALRGIVDGWEFL